MLPKTREGEETVAKRVVVETEKCVGCQSCMFACARRFGCGGLSKSAIAVRSAGGMERGFIIVVCRACSDPPCAKVCPADALKPKPGGGVDFNSDKCLGCGQCVDACTIGAVFWDEETNKPVICIYCGVCVRYCPHGALKFEEV
jgi:Fe-S-cluster-containing dehydrogenase component